MGCMEFTWSTGTGSIEAFSYTIIIVIYRGVFCRIYFAEGRY